VGVRRGIVTVITAVTIFVCTALIVVAGCADPDGVREEGEAVTAAAAPATMSVRSGGDATRQVVRLVKSDPRVAKDIRDNLLACDDSSSYPVDDDHADLTGQGGTDLVVNVSTCVDEVGVATYVYRMEHGKYVNVFADEQPPVVAAAVDGLLKVTHQVYEPQDPVSNPSGEDVTTYRWKGTRFTEVATEHRDYNSSAQPSPVASEESHG
jgi:hypothetical protein